MNIPAKTTVLMALSLYHKGQANGINVKELARATELSEREVRQAVSDLCEDGVAICAHPSSGYFVAENAEELEKNCQFLMSRAMHTLKRVASLKRIALPTLLGQLTLES